MPASSAASSAMDSYFVVVKRRDPDATRHLYYRESFASSAMGNMSVAAALFETTFEIITVAR